ncbi:serine/threonine-protein kinase [Armatimonas rosea]|uniref:Protein kinase domain-containing protein n=1 Tax=Armatimonas rosea TaxID=685828 RepID=A0A7W9ST71_ARMRO|nr:serine/threonine-protein kinase [Armatimonas rosea]MBB6052391.1 hypothetical protein [Armatimonas rosea]
MRENLETLKFHLEQVTCPEQVFGRLEGYSATTLRQALSEVFRSLAKNCHPDRVPESDQALAAEVFRLLNSWRGQAERKLELETYGDQKPLFEPQELFLGDELLTLTGIHAAGLVSTVYEAHFTAAVPGQRVFAKVCREPADNDLLEREFQALRVLHTPHRDPVVEREFYAKQRAYVPVSYAHFTVAGLAGGRQAVNLLSVPEGRCFTAQQLRDEKFQVGVEPRQVWWILRRLFLTLWLAHLKGYAHGAVTPDHLLIYPEAHGIVLLDWTCASRLGHEPVPVYDASWKGFAPPELLSRAPASTSSDLFQAAKTALYLLGDYATTLDAPLQRFLEQCTLPDPTRRLSDAERAHESLGTLLGNRRFAEFIVP